MIFIFTICSMSLLAQTNNAFMCELYKVTKIEDLGKFYLIFLKKGFNNYTIYSEKTIVLEGIKIKVDSLYPFELTVKIDTLSNGLSITHMNYLDIRRFDNRYSGEEIGMLCTAKNVKGLFFLDCHERKKR